MQIGFIGCGTIATSIATGFLSVDSNLSPVVTHCHVTRRSLSNSLALLSKFSPSKVTVHDSAQSILDVEDVGTVFICLLPKACQTVLPRLSFTPERQNIVSLVSTGSLADIRGWTSFPEADTDTDTNTNTNTNTNTMESQSQSQSQFGMVTKMICLPSIAMGRSPSLIVPPTPYLEALLGPLGGTVPCSTEAEMTKMMIPTCLMGPYYKMLKEVKTWLVSEVGCEGNSAKADKVEFFVKEIFMGMAMDLKGKSIQDCIEEQTPGGINEMGVRNWESLGGGGVVDGCCDGVLERLTGKGSGVVSARK